MKKFIALLSIVAFISLSGRANNSTNPVETSNSTVTVAESTGLKGQVKDAKTGELLTGVKLTLVGTGLSTYSDFDGNFEFKNLEAGKYQLKADYISYKEEVTVNYLLKSKEQQNVNVLLKNLVD